MSEELQRLVTQVFYQVKWNSPFLSGNMRGHIEVKPISDTEMQIIIEAPPYDLDEFMNNPFHPIIYIGGDDYAYEVNYKTGGFSGKHKNWVESNVIMACEAVAALYNGEVKSEIGEEK